MKLSTNFNLSEFTKSQTATRKNIKNIPNDQVISSLRMLCINVLEPIRSAFGPVVINSGYRNPTLNKAIGGAKNSQHVLGQAADIEIQRVSNVKLAKWIENNLGYDQLILELYDPTEGPMSGWVHVSWVGSGNRQSTITAKRVSGRIIYESGIVS